MAKAYKETQFENLKKMYLEREHLLAVSSSKGENERTRAEVKEVKDDLYNLHVENASMKKEIKSLETQIASIYGYVHKNLDPLLDVVNAIADTEEGRELIKRINEEKQANARAKVE
jgi:septal ring factor EnvC (AmiA/AmiB activator)